MVTRHPGPGSAELSVMSFPFGGFVHVRSVCSKQILQVNYALPGFLTSCACCYMELPLKSSEDTPK